MTHVMNTFRIFDRDLLQLIVGCDAEDKPFHFFTHSNRIISHNLLSGKCRHNVMLYCYVTS